MSGRSGRERSAGGGSDLRRAVAAVLMVVLAVAALGRPAGAVPAEADAKAFIENLADEAIEALTLPDATRAEKYERFRALLRSHFAVDDIAEWVLGRHWERASEPEKHAYLALFEDWVIVTYVRRFENYSGETLRVSRALTGAGSPDVIVDSQIVRPDVDPVHVGWRVRNYDETLRIVDVFIEGVSMSQTQRADFASIIRRRGGVAGLIEEMERVLDQPN